LEQQTVDTRTKIVSADQAAELARSGATVVSGYFDPLVASLADELADLKRAGSPLLVLIRSLENAILPARARAELVAALAVVDYVCDAECGVEPQHRLEKEHDRRLKELIAHVHARQKMAASSPRPPEGGGS
jgi:hypothetical protein